MKRYATLADMWHDGMSANAIAKVTHTGHYDVLLLLRDQGIDTSIRRPIPRRVRFCKTEKMKRLQLYRLASRFLRRGERDHARIASELGVPARDVTNALRYYIRKTVKR